MGVEDIGRASADGQRGAHAAGSPSERSRCGTGAKAGEAEAGYRSAGARGGDARAWAGRQQDAAVARAEEARPAAEKKSLHAAERDTEHNRARRQAFVETVRASRAEDLIYLDESGVSTQMTRLYGRAERGRRVVDTVPGGHWKMLTVLGAMSIDGIMAAMTIEAATDRDVFLTYLDQVLCPKLREGHVVVMDNLSAHKVAGVRERIEACGASLLYLPPYSPDLNPIEKAWAKLKQGLRAAGARSLDTLQLAIQQLLPTITPQDANAWFRLPLHTL